MINTEWLESLREGDNVAALGNRGDYRIETVHKITDTQILTNHGRYAKKNGLEIGSDIWRKSMLEPVTNDIRYAVKRRLLANKVARAANGLSNDQVDRIEQVINEITNDNLA